MYRLDDVRELDLSVMSVEFDEWNHDRGDAAAEDDPRRSDADENADGDVEPAQDDKLEFGPRANARKTD